MSILIALFALPVALTTLERNRCPAVEGAEPQQQRPCELHGRVQFVEAFPDYRIKFTDAFPDARVQFVSAFANQPGRWEIVESFPDFKVKVVDGFPDFTIEVVDRFPGCR